MRLQSLGARHPDPWALLSIWGAEMTGQTLSKGPWV